MDFQGELHDILLNYMNEDENYIIRSHIKNLIHKYAISAETDIKKDEDFMLENIPKHIDGIKWFVQEYLVKK